MIEVRDLKKYYRGRDAVEGVAFKLSNGGIRGILDPSGECAHVLMALLSGALEPDGGCVIVNGFDTVKEPIRARRSAGYMPRGVFPDEDATVEEYLFFISDAKGLDYELSTRRVKDVLDELELKGRRYSPCGRLTAGERSRLMLAQACIGSPEFLFLEDPTERLGERDTRDIASRILDLGEEHTVFVSSTSPERLEAMCDGEILLLSGGRLVGIFDAQSEQLAAKYRAACEELGIAEDTAAHTFARKKRRPARRGTDTEDRTL